MRRNTEKTVRAWEQGKACKSASSIWTDGEALYSYRTVLLTREAGWLFVNRTKYSPTTSCQQSGLSEALCGLAQVRHVEGVPMGYRGPLSAYADPSLTAVLFS
jgi:hypothetical protein